jgi:hypothetical protein
MGAAGCQFDGWPRPCFLFMFSAIERLREKLYEKGTVFKVSPVYVPR